MHQWRMSFIGSFLVCLATLLFCDYASCNMCSRLRPETRTRTVLEHGECQKSYHAACGWFTSQQCTFYESVPCLVERNQSVTVYRIVMECCPGYELDPINNITCIRKSGQADYNTGQIYEPLLGLSHGALAGIVCLFLFVACVILLVTLHVLKRRHRNEQVKEIKVMEVEMSEKFIPVAKT